MSNTFKDMNGARHRKYTVRKNGYTFLILDRERNIVIREGFATRESAWAEIKNLTKGKAA
jgi:hypothetical protein